MSPAPSRQRSLVARPRGEPADHDARLEEVDVPDPGPGEVRVRSTWLSVDPYMRGRMDDVRSQVPPFVLGEPMTGGAVGVVELVGEGVDDVAEGDVVLHDRGWREGDVVLVSAAAGAVGSVAGQVARLKGASAVVGTAGGSAKVRWLLDDAGFTDAADHHGADLGDLMARLVPGGADVHVDDVGGPALEAAIPRMRDHSRIALCGAVSGYDAESAPPGPRTLGLALGTRLRLEGFMVSDHLARMRDVVPEMAAWIRDGDVVHRETVAEGVESTYDAFRGVLTGASTGKALVRIVPDV